MIPNYHYFLVIAEEGSLSKASRRLLISHQGLSKYLKSLEEQYQVTLFNRKPKLSLTPAGGMLYESLRQIELYEKNLEVRLADFHRSDTGSIKFGTTEARFRVLIPELLVQFQKKYPQVELIPICANSNELREMILDNQLDLMLTASSAKDSARLNSMLIMNEQLYLVISDNLLKKYFSEKFPYCKAEFCKGVNLHDFQDVPFIMNRKSFASRDMIDSYIEKNNIKLNCVCEIVQGDIRYLLAEKDYAACFCPSMLLPGIRTDSRFHLSNSKLNIFPIAGFDTTNPVRLLYLKERIFPQYENDLIALIKEICTQFLNPLPETQAVSTQLNTPH